MLNVNCLNDRGRFTSAPTMHEFQGETIDNRLSRRIGELDACRPTSPVSYCHAAALTPIAKRGHSDIPARRNPSSNGGTDRNTFSRRAAATLVNSRPGVARNRLRSMCAS